MPAASSAPSAKGQPAYNGSRRSAEVFPEGEQLFQPAEASSFEQISSAKVRIRNEALPPIVSAGAGKGGQPPKNEAKPDKEDPAVDPVPPATDPVPSDTDPIDTLPPEDDGTDQLPPHELPGLPGDEDNQLPTDQTPTIPPYNGGGGNNPPTNSVPEGGLTSALLVLGVASLVIAKRRSSRK